MDIGRAGRIRHLRDRIDQAERSARENTRTVAELRRELRQMDQEGYVLVQFNGHAREYCYEVEEPCVIGDYCIVWSPMTNREEIVKVVGLGRGNWTGCNHKVAKRIAYATTGDAVHHRFRNEDSCDQELF